MMIPKERELVQKVFQLSLQLYFTWAWVIIF